MNNRFTEKYGNWVLIAGAADGLGRAFSIFLANQGLNVCLVDNNTEKLKQTLQEVRQISSDSTHLILDLEQEDAASQMMQKVQENGIRLIVYNAAYGPVKPFLANTPEELDRYLNLNARTTIHLVHQFCDFLIKKNHKGGIVLMSSLAGFFGTNLVVPYGATKAFDYNLAEGLYHEMKPNGIDVIGCIAGATDTPNYRNTKPIYPKGLKPSIMKPEKVAKEVINHLGKSGFFIPGRANRFTYFLLTRVLSRKQAGKLMNNTMLKMYQHHFER